MYESFFGLRERPFDLTADPRFLCLTGKHREALATLRYGITGGKGVTMVIGEAGTGKTTLLHKTLEEEAGQNRSIVCVKNPTLTRAEFFEYLTDRFGLSRDASRSKSRFLVEFETRLLQQHEAGGLSALIVDEAQALDEALLEEIRLLANLETATDKLLAVILVGQPELAARLNDPSLRQLKQRVALRCELQPLDLQETASYISARIGTAGGQSPAVFTREAVIAIYEHAGGIPRTISVVCDNALITGFAADQRPVGETEVLEACADLELVKQTTVSRRPRSVSGDTRPPGRQPRPTRRPPSAEASAERPPLDGQPPPPRADARARRDGSSRRRDAAPHQDSPAEPRHWRGFSSFPS